MTKNEAKGYLLSKWYESGTYDVEEVLRINEILDSIYDDGLEVVDRKIDEKTANELSKGESDDWMGGDSELY